MNPLSADEPTLLGRALHAVATWWGHRLSTSERLQRVHKKPPCLGGWMAGFALPERGVLPKELANAIFCTIGDTTGRVLEGGVGKPQVLPGR